MGPEFLHSLSILFHPESIEHALSGINVALHGESINETASGLSAAQVRRPNKI